MKRLILPLLAVAVCGLAAQAEERTFTDKNGRTVRAEIVSYDPSIDVLKIRRSSDGNVFALKARHLSDTDEAWVHEWHEAHYARQAVADAKSRLFVKVEKRTGDTDYGSTGRRNTTARDKFYSLRLINNAEYRLDDYKVRYRIYARDGKGQERFRKGDFTVGLEPSEEAEIDTHSVTIKGVSKEKPLANCSGGG